MVKDNAKDTFREFQDTELDLTGISGILIWGTVWEIGWRLYVECAWNNTRRMLEGQVWDVHASGRTFVLHMQKEHLGNVRRTFGKHIPLC